MKQELAEVAAKHRTTTSHYVRKMLVQQLLGERLHSDWQTAIGQLPHNIKEIEQDAENKFGSCRCNGVTLVTSWVYSRVVKTEGSPESKQHRFMI